MIQIAKREHVLGGISLSDAVDKVLDQQGVHEEIQRKGLFKRIKYEVETKCKNALNLYQMIEAAKEKHKMTGISNADAINRVLDEQGYNDKIVQEDLFNKIDGEIRKRGRMTGRNKALIRRDFPAENIEGVAIAKPFSSPPPKQERELMQGKLF